MNFSSPSSLVLSQFPTGDANYRAGKTFLKAKSYQKIFLSKFVKVTKVGVFKNGSGERGMDSGGRLLKRSTTSVLPGILIVYLLFSLFAGVLWSCVK